MVKLSFKKNNALAPSALPASSMSSNNVSAAKGVALHFFAYFFNYFVVLMCIVVLAAGFWFLILPKYRFVKSDQRVIEEVNVYKQKLSYLKQINQIKALYATVSVEDKKKIDQMLSAGEDGDSLQIALLREISYIVKAQGAIVETPQIQELDTSAGKFIDLNKEKNNTPTDPNVRIIDINMTISHLSYDQLKAILARWERSLRLLDVVKLDYDPALSRAKVELYAYHLQK